jgi:hypothetical protein
VLIDYQQNVFKNIADQDPRVVEVNVCTLARAALDFNVPVVVSVNGPMIPSLKEELCDVTPIDRSSRYAWEDPLFVAAVKATGRKKLVMAGIETSVAGNSAIHSPLTRPSATLSPLMRGEGSAMRSFAPRSGEKVPRSGG